jgi:dsRNA-specific ribonuclease
MLKIQTKTQKGINKETNINMTNKTALSILYEYASQVHKCNPRFEITEKENPKDPYHAICYIGDNIAGKGTGNSKKLAKAAAAEAALSVLIPDYKSQVNTDSKHDSNDDASTVAAY